MSKSIKIIDRLIEYFFVNSKFENKPMFSVIDRLPKELREEMKEIRSDELMNLRKDCL